MLIDKLEILKHREISKNVRTTKINPFIEDSQFLDLKPLLGDAFYVDLIKNQTEVKYIELLDGKEYDYDGKTYSFAGLKKILSIHLHIYLIIRIQNIIT